MSSHRPPTRNLALHLATALLSVFALASCGTVSGPDVNPSELPNGVTPNEVKELEPLEDERGKYVVTSASTVDGDDGFRVRVEERYYFDTSHARFVVRQNDLYLRDQRIGIESIRLSLHRGDEEMSNTKLAATASPTLPETIHVTDPFLVDVSEVGLPERVCAVLEVTYDDERYFPLALSTCDPRSLSLLLQD